MISYEMGMTQPRSILKQLPGQVGNTRKWLILGSFKISSDVNQTWTPSMTSASDHNVIHQHATNTTTNTDIQQCR